MAVNVFERDYHPSQGRDEVFYDRIQLKFIDGPKTD